MKHIRQRPDGCAEACLAMLVGCDLEIARFALGRRNPPSFRQLAAAVRRFGLKLGDEILLHGELPYRCDPGLITLSKDGHNPAGIGHVAVLREGGWVHDPAISRRIPYPRYARHLKRMGLRPHGWFPAYVKTEERERMMRRAAAWRRRRGAA